jgi:hypothetical protein
LVMYAARDAGRLGLTPHGGAANGTHGSSIDKAKAAGSSS